MFLTFEVIATFGVSAAISFTVSSAILLLVAAKRGLLSVRSRPTQKPGMNNATTTALLPPTAPTEKDVMAAEQTPLQSS